MRDRARLIAAILRHASIPIRSIFDAGCGIGLLRKPFADIYPAARYVYWRPAIICAGNIIGPADR
jgi:hypothetical protein